MIFRSVVRRGRDSSHVISHSFLANIGEPLIVDENEEEVGIPDGTCTGRGEELREL